MVDQMGIRMIYFMAICGLYHFKLLHVKCLDWGCERERGWKRAWVDRKCTRALKQCDGKHVWHLMEMFSPLAQRFYQFQLLQSSSSAKLPGNIMTTNMSISLYFVRKFLRRLKFFPNPLDCPPNNTLSFRSLVHVVVLSILLGVSVLLQHIQWDLSSR